MTTSSKKARDFLVVKGKITLQGGLQTTLPRTLEILIFRANSCLSSDIEAVSGCIMSIVYRNIFRKKSEKESRDHFSTEGLIEEESVRQICKVLGWRRGIITLAIIADFPGATIKKLSTEMGCSECIVRSTVIHLQDAGLIYHDKASGAYRGRRKYYVRDKQIFVALQMILNIGMKGPYDYVHQRLRRQQERIEDFQVWAKDEMGVKIEIPPKEEKQRKTKKRRKPIKNHLNGKIMFKGKHS